MSRLIEDYIRELFDEKKISEENREKLWKYYYDKLSKGVDVGWKQNFEIDDKDLVTSLKQSIAEFSAFKETAFRKELEELLVKDGKLMPWSEFKKEALKVSGDYNARWLETEYHQTVANANAAAQWKDFQRNAELYPNLKLVSVRDARVRPEHKALDGTIRPLNDPFWDNHLPPLDWGCRCHVEQTDEEPTEVKGGVQMKIEFENNPGKTGKIFGGSAYMTVGGLNPEMIEKIGNWGRKMFNKVAKNARIAFEKSKLKAPYLTKYVSENGLKIKVSPFADKKDLQENIETAKLLIEKFDFDIKIRPHLDGSIISNYKNAEYEILGKLAERKAPITNNVKNLRNIYRKATEQGCEIIVIDLNQTILTINQVEEEVYRKFEKFPQIKNVFIIKDGNAKNVKKQSK